jgi:hypothetical protein
MNPYTRNRPSLFNLRNAQRAVQMLQSNGTPITVSLLNILLAVAAERGNSEYAFSVLTHDFGTHNLEPNADSFCFAIESLGKNALKERHTSHATEVINNILMKAEAILSIMESAGIVPTQHIIKEYTEVLCQTGQLETATEVVFDTYNDLGSVSSKTVYRVAMANARAGRHEIAREIAKYSDLPVPFLTHNIDLEEKYYKKHIELERLRQLAEKSSSSKQKLVGKEKISSIANKNTEIGSTEE